LRFLYRNEILSALDEARAELKYQLGRGREANDAVDAADLLELLIQAQKASGQWVDFVDEQDLREAMQLVEQEG
jgi:hypothetical protein